MELDALVGANIAAVRKRRGMSQAELADAMSAEGWRFHQQTVLKLEKGQRALRLAEAVALARVLDVNVSLLTKMPAEFPCT